MIKILTAEQMRSCDRRAIEDYGVPDLVLMENAGVQVVEAMEEFFGDQPPLSVGVCCGKGNNGGDGLVVARHLANLGRDVTVYLFAAGDSLEGSPAKNLAIARAMEIEIVEIPDEASWRQMSLELGEHDCLIDALFGTGITGGLRGHWGQVVEAINDSLVPVIAVDIPSGLSTDSGAVAGPAVLADLTVTFAAPKLCHALAPAEEHCGELRVVDIGIPQAAIDAVDDAVTLLTPDYCGELLLPRDPDTHKGTYGRVLVVAGSPGTTGAAVLTALGALRGGAGLVTVATPESVYGVVAGQLTEALVRPMAAEPDSGGISTEALDDLLELAGDMDVLALGPGLGTHPQTVQVVRRLVGELGIPTVVDADGINALAGGTEIIENAGGARVLTPHPGEMARLVESTVAEVQADRLGAARRLARSCRCTLLLKGYRSVIASADETLVLNPTGNPGMASGGSGDVLTGLVAAFIGQGIEAAEAACLGAFVHGLAGDLAAESIGETALVAGDLVDHLPDAFRWLEETVGGASLW